MSYDTDKEHKKPPECEPSSYADSIICLIDWEIYDLRQKESTLTDSICSWNCTISALEQKDKDDPDSGLGWGNIELQKAKLERDEERKTLYELQAWLNYSEKVKSWFVKKIMNQL